MFWLGIGIGLAVGIVVGAIVRSKNAAIPWEPAGPYSDEEKE